VLSKFDKVSIWILRGGTGSGEYLKESTVKSTATPIDKEYAESLFV
jgi:hypothetical protein